MQIEKIKEIIALIQASDISELEITEGDDRLKITRVLNGAVVTQVVSSNQTVAIVDEPIIAKKVIKSPMVGTFYRSPSPDSDKFVEVGMQINIGKTVCIIEAMKLLNQIESEHAGVVKEILVKDGSPVEYGQILMIIE